MKKTLFILLTLSLITNICEARPSSRKYTSSYTSHSIIDNTTAQGVANAMAEHNYIGHFGGHGIGYEGCGSGYSQEQAYNNCCFARNTNLTTIDVGYAQGKNGRWFCCRRYR